MVGQRVTISLILLTKERTSHLCFNCTRISSKHQVSPHSSQKRTVSLEPNTCVILHSRVRDEELNWLINPKQLDTLHWDYESYPWSIISSGDFVPRLAESCKRLITASEENKSWWSFRAQNLATSAREPLSRYRQDASLLGFPSSLDQEDPPSLPGTEIFSPWWMTAGPWETWGMEASISCTKEKIWQIRSETNPRECRVLAFCKGLPWKKCFLCLQVMTACFFFFEGYCSLTISRLRSQHLWDDKVEEIHFLVRSRTWEKYGFKFKVGSQLSKVWELRVECFQSWEKGLISLLYHWSLCSPCASVRNLWQG